METPREVRNDLNWESHRYMGHVWLAQGLFLNIFALRVALAQIYHDLPIKKCENVNNYNVELPEASRVFSLRFSRVSWEFSVEKPCVLMLGIQPIFRKIGAGLWHCFTNIRLWFLKIVAYPESILSYDSFCGLKKNMFLWKREKIERHSSASSAWGLENRTEHHFAQWLCGEVCLWHSLSGDFPRRAV